MFDSTTNALLQSVVDTEISPELIPDSGTNDEPFQKTESVIGPYELQDFNLYYISRFGFRPSKVAYLAFYAWSNKNHGVWPQYTPENKRNEYDLKSIKHWLEVFLYRQVNLFLSQEKKELHGKK